jgi:hypothetical protein
VLGFQLQLIKFLGLDKDVMTLGVLVALDDLLFGYLFEAALGLNTLLGI